MAGGLLVLLTWQGEKLLADFWPKYHWRCSEAFRFFAEATLHLEVPTICKPAIPVSENLELEPTREAIDGSGFGSKTGGSGSGSGSEPSVFVRFLVVLVRFGGSGGFLVFFWLCNLEFWIYTINLNKTMDNLN